MRTPKCLLALCLCLIMILTNFELALANSPDPFDASPLTDCEKPTPYILGLELDALPYILGGYFGAITFGKNSVSLRLLIAGNATKPDFIIPSDFTNNKLDAYAVLLDFPIFQPKKYYENKFWLSFGLVKWNSSIENKQDHAISNYSNTLLSLGMSYQYFLSRNFYISPWIGMHIRVAGESEIPVGNKTYNVPLFNPEASIKFGYNLYFRSLY